jgi:hypothetical protein
LTNEICFRDLAIDDEVFQKIIVEYDNQYPNPTKGSNLTQPQLHTMPRGVVSLDNLFDLQEKFKNQKISKPTVHVHPMKS